MSETTTVPLGQLQTNDYNYRTAPMRHGGSVSMDVSSLADSIENVGLDNALTVRPIGDEKFEVVTGERRFHALQAAFDDDHEVKVDVEDLTDEQARERCRAENAEREDLTTMQEAWGYAESVTVEYRGEEESFAEYVESVKAHELSGNIQVPSDMTIDRNGYVENRSGNYVSDRLSFLILPEEAHEWLDEGELSKRAAREISSRVRSGVDDPEYALDMMADLAEDYGPEYGTMRNGDYDTLVDDINDRIDTHNRHKEEAKEDVEIYREKIIEKLEALANDLETAFEDFDTPYPVPPIPEGDEVTTVDDIIAALDDDDIAVDDINFDGITQGVAEYREKLDARSSELNDEIPEKESQLDDVRERMLKLERVVSNHNDGSCPYCRQDVNVEEIQDVVSSEQDWAEGISSEIRDHRNTVDDIASMKSALHRDIEQLETAREKYDEAYADAMELDIEVDQ